MIDNLPLDDNARVIHLPVIAYHQISSDSKPKDPWRLTVPIKRFERQMRYLHEHGYRSVSLAELLNLSANGLPGRKKCVVITFDDGYENFLTLAYPILQRYKFTATVFLITDRIRERDGQKRGSDDHFLSWQQIMSLQKDGISFGSHTCTHFPLTRLSKMKVWHELVSSKECLEKRLGKKAQLLAYPYGDSNLEIQDMAKKAGYEAACGINRGRCNRFNLWRTQCHTNDSLLSFMVQLTQWPYYAKWFREESSIGQFLRKFKHQIRH
jgi:peptidoglycan/xylan/chitin deacetylase (PgdA/CDA1 family)